MFSPCQEWLYQIKFCPSFLKLVSSPVSGFSLEACLKWESWSLSLPSPLPGQWFCCYLTLRQALASRWILIGGSTPVLISRIRPVYSPGQVRVASSVLPALPRWLSATLPSSGHRASGFFPQTGCCFRPMRLSALASLCTLCLRPPRPHELVPLAAGAAPASACFWRVAAALWPAWFLFHVSCFSCL